MVIAKFFTLVTCLLLVHNAQGSLPLEVLQDIRSQKVDVDRIINLMKGDFKHKAYEFLDEFITTFGARFTGTKRLEDSIDYMLDYLNDQGFDNVHGENVTVPNWRRISEYGRIISPFDKELEVLTLGSAISTNGMIEADVLVVKSFEELEERASEAVGKIVVFNQEWQGYKNTKPYRSGAVQASKAGAIASLSKSITPFSLYTPHTGSLKYNESIAPKIPTGCITIEDAELLQRFQDLGKPIRIRLNIQTEIKPDTTSRNIVAEIKGSKYPEQIVLFGGHIDSWDVGVGAMDDGAGCTVSLMVFLLMKELGIRPKRTLRLVLWTAEEQSFTGAHQYYVAHKHEKDNFVWMLESDAGVYKPSGMRFTGSGLAKAYLEEIMQHLAPLGTTEVLDGASNPDLSMWDPDIPKGTVAIDRSKYFWYHHTKADTMLAVDPDVMDEFTVVYASAIYCVANLDHRLPWEGEHPGVDQGSYMSPVLLVVAFITAYLFNSTL